MRMFGFLKRKMKRACEMVMPGNYVDVKIDDQWNLRGQSVVWYDAVGKESCELEYQTASPAQLLRLLAWNQVIAESVAKAMMSMTLHPVGLGSMPTDDQFDCTESFLQIQGFSKKQDLEDD
ncbi:MAG: hypothetical protein IKQ93_06135 [Candidatus Methanomethylophilaceae archaeon]|nr:hypothetical protein [Candidatus Methanomethylophilaceae archaeon]